MSIGAFNNSSHHGCSRMTQLGVAAIPEPAGLRLQTFSSSPTLQGCQGPHPLLSCASKSPSQLVRSFAVAHQDTNRPHSSRSPCRCRSHRRRSHFSPSLSSPTRLSNLRSLVCAHLVVPPSSIVVSLVTGKH
ncbi:uncharacterized protein DS421_3g77530 [Arachis hypogaea]|nr:uncharacterized protein DS421_3g77530 [Arachis hypogaea]